MAQDESTRAFGKKKRYDVKMNLAKRKLTLSNLANLSLLKPTKEFGFHDISLLLLKAEARMLALDSQCI